MYEGVPNVTLNKPTKSHCTNCKWHINLSRPDSLIYVTTLFNEHSGHNLDVLRSEILKLDILKEELPTQQDLKDLYKLQLDLYKSKMWLMQQEWT
ncbi:hypothetical protein RclHR1_02320007 [Rhizophagus clarus]|uniref:Uncharacterized protein n=1 Tax=Rhizophagus clarus TaxID=94130 RepID=A0A2Z6R0B3_9GLOM|nr:hypothetical protein RclHR1_02320007 [Rhizophagus clarus]GES85878.1 hypothetical protein RCL_jg26759.t1 [Rhizophagus clarus]